MSRENITAFYAELERNRELRREALGLSEMYSDQEKRIEAFLELARTRGYSFSIREYFDFLYEQAGDIPEKSGGHPNS